MMSLLLQGDVVSKTDFSVSLNFNTHLRREYPTGHRNNRIDCRTEVTTIAI